MRTNVLLNTNEVSAQSVNDIFEYSEQSAPLLPNKYSIQREGSRSYLFDCLYSCKISKQFRLTVLIIIVIIAGGLNRLAGKVVTVPMGEYSFFLGLFNAIMYVIMYGIILASKWALGMVPTDDILYVWRGHNTKGCCSLSGPWKYFIIIGFLDGLNNILTLIASPYLPGTLISLLAQTNVFFSLISAVVILKSRYTYWQIWSVVLLMLGVTATLMPEFDMTIVEPSPLYSIIMGASTLPQAISVTIKEKMFREKADLDLFVINTFGSLFQLFFVPVYLPLTILFDQTHGIPFLEYVHNGIECFLGTTPLVMPGYETDCSPDPYPYLVYIILNLFFNLVLLLLVKKASAVLSFMAFQAVLPVSVFLFYFNWPLLKATPFSPWTVGGLFVIIISLVLFQFFSLEKKKHNLSCVSFSLPYLEKKLESRVSKKSENIDRA